MSLQEVTEQVRSRVGDESGLGAKVKFDFGDDGVLFIDGASTPNQVTNEDAEADTTVTMSLDDFKEMAKGELDPTAAFMMGKIKVSGDMTVAMKLSQVI